MTRPVVDLNKKLATYREVIAKAKTGKKKGTTVEPPADVEESIKDALAELAVAREEQLMAAEGFFSQHANLLTEDARYHWDKIVEAQCDTAPWIDLLV